MKALAAITAVISSIINTIINLNFFKLISRSSYAWA